jgi:hypothetical protein
MNLISLHIYLDLGMVCLQLILYDLRKIINWAIDENDGISSDYHSIKFDIPSHQFEIVP